MPGRDLARDGFFAADTAPLQNVTERCCSRADEVREKFERFGEIRDVYLPRDFYTGYDTSSVPQQYILHKQVGRRSWQSKGLGVRKQEQD